jgi:hypothetical protein
MSLGISAIASGSCIGVEDKATVVIAQEGVSGEDVLALQQKIDHRAPFPFVIASLLLKRGWSYGTSLSPRPK